jgi:septal ring factor EnvC (AmiA/AmiB activator)
MAVFAFIVDNVIDERSTAIERNRLQEELMQKEIRICELEIGRLKKYSSDLEATVQKLEIVIDIDNVRKEAERVMGTEFFQDLMNQVAVVKRRRATESPTPIPQPVLLDRQSDSLCRCRGTAKRFRSSSRSRVAGEV